MREMRRVARPGGGLALIEPDFSTTTINLPDRPAVRRALAHETDTAVVESWLPGALLGLLRIWACRTSRSRRGSSCSRRISAPPTSRASAGMPPRPGPSRRTSSRPGSPGLPDCTPRVGCSERSATSCSRRGREARARCRCPSRPRDGSAGCGGARASRRGGRRAPRAPRARRPSRSAGSGSRGRPRARRRAGSRGPAAPAAGRAGLTAGPRTDRRARPPGRQPKSSQVRAMCSGSGAVRVQPLAGAPGG